MRYARSFTLLRLAFVFTVADLTHAVTLIGTGVASAPRDYRQMLREGGSPGGSNLGSSSEGLSAAHRAAEPHGDADRLFTATSVL